MSAFRLIEQGVPGRVVVITLAYVDGAAAPQILRSDGRTVPYSFEGGPPGRSYRWYSLAAWRLRCGGDEGEVIDPFLQQPHRVSLRPWAGADPETTALNFSFAWEPDEPIPPGDPRYPTPPWRQ